MFQRPEGTYDISKEVVINTINSTGPLSNIARFLPENSKVLDIGCGNGLLADVLAELGKKMELDGLEPNKYAAEIAAPKYRKFYCGFVGDYAEEIEQENYQYVVMADVIEHMVDPLSFLQELLLLIPKAKFLISVPNVAFGAVRIALWQGKFDYVDSGLLERTHLRFFTYRTIQELIDKIGLFIEKEYFLCKKFYRSEIPVDIGNLSFSSLKKLVHDEMSQVYQFLFVLGREKREKERVIFGGKTTYKHLLRLFIRAKYTRIKQRLMGK